MSVLEVSQAERPPIRHPIPEDERLVIEEFNSLSSIQRTGLLEHRIKIAHKRYVDSSAVLNNLEILPPAPQTTQELKVSYGEYEKPPNREVAFLFSTSPGEIRMVVDPTIAQERFKNKRFMHSVRKDMGLKVARGNLAPAFLSEDKGLFSMGHQIAEDANPKLRERMDMAFINGDSGAQDSHDKRVHNVSNWYEYVIKGDITTVHSRDTGDRLGALLQREIEHPDNLRVIENDRDQRDIVMRDMTRVSGSKKILLHGEGQTPARQITDEHDVPNLDLAIRLDVAEEPTTSKALTWARIGAKALSLHGFVSRDQLPTTS